MKIESLSSIAKRVLYLLTAVMLFAMNPVSAKDALPTTREMNLLCWQEFQELVPERIQTVLLPVGSLEPHGVTPNGTDNLAPEAMARAIADQLEALIAPTLNYGITTDFRAFPGTVTIAPETYAPFIREILINLADNGFRNIIILNGHGGNTTVLDEVMSRVSNDSRVRIMIINWWSVADDITKAVFHENGGHAADNETAYIQAVYPQHVHPERYSKEMVSVNPPKGSYLTAPAISSIFLYEEGQGYPAFRDDQAQEYFTKVNAKVAGLIAEVIAKWDLAGLYR